MKNSKIIFILAAFLFSNNAFAGGPWPQKKGNGYFKVSEWWTVFDQHFTDQGKIDPNVTTGIFNTSLYAEYGLTSRLTGVVYFPFLSRNYMNDRISATTGETLTKGEAINTIGDTDVSLKYGLSKPGSKIPLAATLTFGIPLGKTSGGAEGNLQTGDGEFNQLLQVDAGTSFPIGKSINGYASAYVGVNNRTNGFSDEFRYGLEFGAGFWKNKLWIISRLTAVESFKNGDTAESITSTSIFANNTEFTSFGLEVAYYVTERVGLSAGFAGAFRGEVVAASPSYSVGVFYDLKR
ncbi:MAG: hypothetical protein AB8F74_00770 [Saprospiraceae bacterium]